MYMMRSSHETVMQLEWNAIGNVQRFQLTSFLKFYCFIFVFVWKYY